MTTDDDLDDEDKHFKELAQQHVARMRQFRMDEAIRLMQGAFRIEREAKLNWLMKDASFFQKWQEWQHNGGESGKPKPPETLREPDHYLMRGDRDPLYMEILGNGFPEETRYSRADMEEAIRILLEGSWKSINHGECMYRWRSENVNQEENIPGWFGALRQIAAAYYFMDERGYHLQSHHFIYTPPESFDTYYEQPLAATYINSNVRSPFTYDIMPADEESPAILTITMNTGALFEIQDAVRRTWPELARTNGTGLKQ